MYVCLCNGLREQDLCDAANREGHASVRSLYSCMGCQPVCGRCVPYVEENILPSAKGANR